MLKADALVVNIRAALVEQNAQYAKVILPEALDSLQNQCILVEQTEGKYRILFPFYVKVEHRKQTITIRLSNSIYHLTPNGVLSVVNPQTVPQLPIWLIRYRDHREASAYIQPLPLLSEETPITEIPAWFPVRDLEAFDTWITIEKPRLNLKIQPEDSEQEREQKITADLMMYCKKQLIAAEGIKLLRHASKRIEKLKEITFIMDLLEAILSQQEEDVEITAEQKKYIGIIASFLYSFFTQSDDSSQEGKCQNKSCNHLKGDHVIKYGSSLEIPLSQYCLNCDTCTGYQEFNSDSSESQHNSDS